MASPVTNIPGDLVSPAVAGNKAILEAAEATPSIKRVVFTASMAGIQSFERLLLKDPANQAVMSGRGDEVPTLTAEATQPTPSPVSDDAPPFRRYFNSKAAALNLVREYGDAHMSETVGFSIVNLMPGWILGPEELTRSKQEAFKGSNMMLGWLFSELSLAPSFGLDADEAAPLLAETFHLDDVVECHVKALDTAKVPGKYRNFLLCSHTPCGPVVMDAADIVRRELPQEVADGKIPFAGELGRLPSSQHRSADLLKVRSRSDRKKANEPIKSLGTIPGKFDATPTERDLLGRTFKSYDEQVTDTIRWYVHLKD